jgi:hypothetical protein
MEAIHGGEGISRISFGNFAEQDGYKRMRQDCLGSSRLNDLAFKSASPSRAFALRVIYSTFTKNVESRSSAQTNNQSRLEN